MTAFISLFSDHTFRVVALGASLLGLVTGGLGAFAFLRKQSLLGDGVAHCALPGVILAFLLTGEKNLEILLLGGLLSGLLGYLLIQGITQHSTIKFDSALATVLAVFFGFAMVLLTISQKIPNANQAGLDSFIYGQAAAMLKRDVRLIGFSAVVVFATMFVCWKQFKLLTFDPEFAFTLGYPNKKINLLLTFLVISAIIIGLQTVGVILMSAMLVTPAVSARCWTGSLGQMVLLSSLTGGLSGFVGTVFSSLYPGMPTGAVIVVVMTLIAFFSLIFGRNQRIWRTQWQKQRFFSSPTKEDGPCHHPVKS